MLLSLVVLALMVVPAALLLIRESTVPVEDRSPYAEPLNEGDLI